MSTETYIPTYHNLDELQLLLNIMGTTAGKALDDSELSDSAASVLWLISTLCDTAARDIGHLLRQATLARKD